MRLARAGMLIDSNPLSALAQIRETADGGLVVGAWVRHTALTSSPLVPDRAPVLAEAARYLGHWVISNRGTPGESLAHADPSAELPTVVAAREARLEASVPIGTRERLVGGAPCKSGD